MMVRCVYRTFGPQHMHEASEDDKNKNNALLRYMQNERNAIMSAVSRIEAHTELNAAAHLIQLNYFA